MVERGPEPHFDAPEPLAREPIASEPPPTTPSTEPIPGPSSPASTEDLLPPGTIEGIVLRAARPVGGGEAWLVRHPFPGDPRWCSDCGPEIGAERVPVGADGIFRFFPVAPGEYCVGVEIEPGLRRARSLRIAEGVSAQRWVISLGSAEIRGHVWHEDGSPAGDVRIRFDLQSASADPWSSGSTRTDLDGAYRLRGLDQGAFGVEALLGGAPRDPRNKGLTVQLGMNEVTSRRSHSRSPPKAWCFAAATASALVDGMGSLGSTRRRRVGSALQRRRTMSEMGLAIAEARAERTEDGEARAELVGMARERFGRIPPTLLADHVLGLDRNADWPVRREAMEALKRRWVFADRDGLHVSKCPDGRALGEYATRARDRRARPYRTVLAGIVPVRGSCGCPDFRRGSLGLCKHLLVVLARLAGKKRAWERALREQPPEKAPQFVWIPRRPLLGADDWLERVRFVPQGTTRSRLSSVAGRFTRGVGAEWVLKTTFVDEPERRLALVQELARSARGGDPALEARLEEEIRELERIVRLRRAAPRLQQLLKGLKRRLYPYQREGVLRFLGRGRLLLADDMGLGKTVQAIAACHALFGGRIVDRGLLVVPAPLKHQWLREWQATSNVPLEIVDGSQEERARTYQRTKRGFLIANYEQLLRDLELVQAWEPDLGVLDEAQRIKNWQAKTSQVVKSLRPDFRLVLTGTPMENRLDELASIMDWVDDHALEPKWRLVPLHAQMADGRRAIVGARHLNTLRARLAPHSLRRLRREVLDQLPVRTDTTIPIDLTPSQRAAHDELDRPIVSLLRIAERRPLTQEEFLRLMQLLLIQRQICNGLALVDFKEVWPSVSGRRPTPQLLASLDSPKLVELRTLVESLTLDQGRKCVVFSQWRRMLELAAWAVSDLMKEAGLRAAFFTGHEGSRRRTQNIVDFHDDPAVRLLFATDAGGVGLNLQRAASACLLLELPWNPAVLEQRVGRIHRLGQTEPVEVYAIVARGGIEERIAGLVADKRALFRGLFDGESDEVLFDRSGAFLEQLRRVVGPPRRPSRADESDEEPDEEVTLDPADAAEGAAEVEPVAAPAPVPGPPAELLAGLRVERAPDGGVRIAAPPENAGALIALLEGLASALRAELANAGLRMAGGSSGIPRKP